jgi:hypothetical protein
MPFRRRQKPCARCRHPWEIHSMLIMDHSTAVRDGEPRELRVPCGHVDLTPAFGGLFRFKACDCPGYVAPASRRLRWANALLGQATNPGAWALVFVLYLSTVIFGLSVLGWSL